ncbi:TPA: restriction endonuclease subunit S [Proteus mirabilis]
MSNGISKTDLNLIPAGYKQTEVGVIPEDWDVIQLGDCASYVGSGKTNTKSRGEYPLYGSTGLIGSCELPEYSGESLLVARVGANAGRLNYVYGEYGVSDNTILIKIKPTNNISFFKYWLIRKNLNTLVFGSGQPLITGTQLKELYLPLPSNTEQTTIANALSDVDLLISELDKLIAKKQAIKTATMQQLLTGRTRLPQFALHEDGSKKSTKQSELGEIPEDWEKFTFDEVISFCSSGATPYRGNKSFYKGTIRWITSGELNYCTIYDTIEKISDDAVLKANLKIHPAGTFLMAITGLEAAGTRGACGITGQPSATNQSCMAIYPNEKLITPYLYFWYTYNGEDLAFKYCQGTKQLSYTAGLIKKIPLYLPVDIKEQTAIATILSDMDEEIQALKQRLSKTRQIKQGMMQELLTGKTRLI